MYGVHIRVHCDIGGMLWRRWGEGVTSTAHGSLPVFLFTLLCLPCARLLLCCCASCFCVLPIVLLSIFVHWFCALIASASWLKSVFYVLRMLRARKRPERWSRWSRIWIFYGGMIEGNQPKPFRTRLTCPNSCCVPSGKTGRRLRQQ